MSSYRKSWIMKVRKLRNIQESKELLDGSFSMPTERRTHSLEVEIEQTTYIDDCNEEVMVKAKTYNKSIEKSKPKGKRIQFATNIAEIIEIENYKKFNQIKKVKSKENITYKNNIMLF